MKQIFTLILLLTSIQAICQGICSGNLGSNIFTAGDFGSGSNPVVLANPNIAPGYQYTTQVPFDGAYTICSRTSALSGLYPSWLRVEDNSSDPNGYMMVVNASYEPGIFYEETVNDLCENTLYEFSADIINLIKSGTSNHTDPNVTFLIDDVIVYETGNIPKTEQWVKFGFSFVTNASQSSVKLTLKNNAPGGNGNDLALDNISFRACGPASFIGLEDESSTVFLCVDDNPLTVTADIMGDNGETFAILWQSSLDGVNWVTITDNTSSSIQHTIFTPGDYYYRYLSAGNEINIQNEKCRIISDLLKITVIPDTYDIQDTLCIGELYNFGDQALTTSGFYTEDFQSSRGCDSTVFLDLEFVSPRDIDIVTEATDPSCYEFVDGNILVTELSGGYGDLNFDIYFNNGFIALDSLAAGEYNVIATDRFLCKDTLSVVLNQPDIVDIELGMDQAIKLGDYLNISPEYSQNFPRTLWNINGEIDCSDCPIINVLPYSSGFAVGSVSIGNNCSDMDSLYISVSEENLVHLPNIFSPNEDGINDYMTIHWNGNSVASINKFSVYDRWGGLIYNSPSPIDISNEIIWDGYSNDKLLASGIYTYYLNITYLNGKQHEIINTITILR